MKKVKIIIIGLAVVLLVAAIVALLRLNRNNHLSFGTDSEIDPSANGNSCPSALRNW